MFALSGLFLLDVKICETVLVIPPDPHPPLEVPLRGRSLTKAGRFVHVYFTVTVAPSQRPRVSGQKCSSYLQWIKSLAGSHVLVQWMKQTSRSKIQRNQHVRLEVYPTASNWSPAAATVMKVI